MKKRNGFVVMARLIGLVRPLTGYMLLAVTMGLIGHLCVSFITVFGAYGVLSVLDFSAPLGLGFLLAAMCLFALARGFLRYAEQSCKGSKAWFKRVGVVYQNPNYQLFMPTAAQEIAFGAASKEYAREIMELFGLSHLAERHPQSLSEGQKRRLSIAAVAASQPDVLLLDEPTVGQDYAGLCDLVHILNRLHEESGNTMITVTHDVRCAETLCDHAAVIRDGVIAREGGKELVRHHFTI